MKTKLSLILCLLAAQFTYAQWSDKTTGINNDLKSVHFVDGNNGWIAGRQGKILRTTDGGATWTEQNSGTTNDLNKIFMVNTNTGYAVGKSGTFVKYNGSTWTKIDIGFSQSMHGVYFLDENTGWISGDWGRIMKTDNGGTSWTTQMSNAIFSNLFYDLHMISSTEGWAVGTSGKVLKYDGSNWSNVSTPANADLYSVDFSSSNNGFMTGKNSTIFQYKNGSWSAHNTSLPDNSFHVYDVIAVDDSKAFAATSPGFGGAGIILQYNGSSWTKDYEFTGMGTELFYGIDVSPQGTGFAVGAGGMLKVKTGAHTGMNKMENEEMVTVYPNPFSSKAFLTYSLKEAEEVEFTLYDVSGKILHNASFRAEAGEHVLEINGNDVKHGICFYALKTANNISCGKLIRH